MDKPLRIIGDPYKVQVCPLSSHLFLFHIWYVLNLCQILMLRFCLLFLSSKHVKWCKRFCESGIILASTETSTALEWVGAAVVVEESRCEFDSVVLNCLHLDTSVTVSF